MAQTLRRIGVALFVAFGFGATPGASSAQNFPYDPDLLPNLATNDIEAIGRNKTDLLSLMVTSQAFSALDCKLIGEHPAKERALDMPRAIAAIQRQHGDVLFSMMMWQMHPAATATSLWVGLHSCESAETQAVLGNLFMLFVDRTLADGWSGR